MINIVFWRSCECLLSFVLQKQYSMEVDKSKILEKTTDLRKLKGYWIIVHDCIYILKL
jgi:hypothetical protein